MASMYPHLRLPPCHKCTGKLAYYQDEYGPYLMCLQCGSTNDLAVSAQQVREAVDAVRDLSGPAYEKTGCDESTTCLECPLPDCKRDRPDLRTLRKDQQRIQLILDENLTNAQAATRLGTSRRTIERTWSRDAARRTG